MNRWKPPPFHHALSTACGALLAAAAMALAPAAHAQAVSAIPEQAPQPVRSFPKNALRGEMVVTAQPPLIQLDGHADQLAPGARIYGPNNRIVLSGTLVGLTLTVNYTRDTMGLVHDVWILTDAEARLPRATAQNPNFVFESQINRSGPHDDGKTPFDKLPVFPNQ
ncbi:MAG: hypothetical protein OJF60_000945 [Burkholderiaceae bacterium]|jgi:hypothetical protein|nr:MAG: hypothetical protein OJF60_000945 [Burkholderiaceae bacterium]